MGINFHIHRMSSSFKKTQRILFIHIMKTAGTSFRHMLENEYGGHQVYPGDFYLLKQPVGYYPLGREILKNYTKLPPHKVLVGHFTAAMNDMLPISYRTAIFLREPVQRSLSMLSHYSRTLGISESRLIENQNFMSTHIADYQTRILGASGVCDPSEVEVIDEKVFSKAQKRLKIINFVGITEEFEKSCQIFDCMFKTKISDCVKKDNVFRPNCSKIEEYISLIEPLIKRDQALYKSALERFNKDLEFYDQHINPASND